MAQETLFNFFTSFCVISHGDAIVNKSSSIDGSYAVIDQDTSGSFLDVVSITYSESAFNSIDNKYISTLNSNTPKLETQTVYLKDSNTVIDHALSLSVTYGTGLSSEFSQALQNVFIVPYYETSQFTYFVYVIGDLTLRTNFSIDNRELGGFPFVVFWAATKSITIETDAVGVFIAPTVTVKNSTVTGSILSYENAVTLDNAVVRSTANNGAFYPNIYVPLPASIIISNESISMYVNLDIETNQHNSQASIIYGQTLYFYFNGGIGLYQYRSKNVDQGIFQYQIDIGTPSEYEGKEVLIVPYAILYNS
jgi:hypothetical protein